jgi:hypothetical protein
MVGVSAVVSQAFAALLLGPVALVAVVLLIAMALADRREPDPTGRRPYAVYLFVVTFISTFVVLFAATAVVSSLADLALPEGGRPWAVSLPEEGPPPAVPAEGSELPRVAELRPFDPDRERARDAVRAGLVGLVAAVVLAFHVRRIAALGGEGLLTADPVRRTYTVYLYAVCLVSVLIVLGAGSAALYALVRIAFPGVTGFEGGGVERAEGIRQLASGGFAALVGGGLFAFHWKRAQALTRGQARAPEPPPGPPGA